MALQVAAYLTAWWVGVPFDAGLPPRPSATRDLMLRPPAQVQMTDERSSFLLKPARGGGLRWDGEDLRADISADGQVVFRAKSANDPLGLDLPIPIPFPLPQPHAPGTPTLQGAVRGLVKGKRPRPVPPDRDAPGRPDLPPGSQLVDSCRAVGDLNCIPRMDGLVVPVISGAFDASDWLPDSVKRDPHREIKARFLAATAPLRARLSASARKDALDEGLMGLRARLESVWSDPGATAAQRRQTLFELWRESDDTSSAGRHARATIEAFIRRRLPAGSPDAFTPAELSTLRAAPDGALFAP